MAKTDIKYENNPFFIATNGISLLVSLAQGVTIFLIGLSLFNYFRGFIGKEPDATPKEQIDTLVSATNAYTINEWLITGTTVLIIAAGWLLVSALLGGMSSYTSARIARGHKVRLIETFRVALHNVFPYLWLQIIIFAKLLLWSLLLFIPALIMAVRYSLAGVAFYDDKKQLRGNAAIKESLRLTKGAWITTFSANALLTFLTFGVFSSLISTAVNTVLYRQYTAYDTKKTPKPAAHILSWITLLTPLILIGIAIFAVITLITSAGISGLLNRL